MSFREFVRSMKSTRNFELTPLKGIVTAEMSEHLRKINNEIGREMGFRFIMLENGDEVYNNLKGIGGYSGVMIRSPHYIGLVVVKDDRETEFHGAYFMQSLVKKLHDMELGSCWIDVRGIPRDIKSKLLKNEEGDINYLLAFGEAEDKAVKQKASLKAVKADASYKQDPYGIGVNDAVFSDRARHSVGEIVYLYEWGRQATYEELEGRGLADLFYYVRNAPSYKNLQPCRFILKDGEAELVVLNPDVDGSYTDAGIMMYTLEGLAKDMGIPGNWNFIRDQSENKEYKVAAKITL